MVLQPSELTKPIKTSHGRFLYVKALSNFFASFQPGEDKYRLFFWLMLETGMRVKEVCAVQEKDFTQNYRKIRIIPCKNPKERRVTLSPYLSAFIQRWCEHNRQRFQYDYIFPTQTRNKYTHMTPQHARGFLSMKRKQLNLTPVRITPAKPHGFCKQTLRKRYALENHSFRRFYETRLTKISNGNYMLIASIMQYDDPTIVRKYFDDSQSIDAEELLSEKYHEEIIAPILQDRPILPGSQQTLTNYDDKKDKKKEVWAMIKQKYSK